MLLTVIKSALLYKIFLKKFHMIPNDCFLGLFLSDIIFLNFNPNEEIINNIFVLPIKLMAALGLIFFKFFLKKRIFLIL